MPTRLLLEGPDIESLLTRVRDEHGSGARIVSADKVRTGGLGGFFAKEKFEVAVEVEEQRANSDRTPGRHAASESDVDASAATSLADLAERADDAERELAAGRPQMNYAPRHGGAISAPANHAAAAAPTAEAPAPAPAPRHAEPPSVDGSFAEILAGIAHDLPAPAPAPFRPADPPAQVTRTGSGSSSSTAADRSTGGRHAAPASDPLTDQQAKPTAGAHGVGRHAAPEPVLPGSRTEPGGVTGRHAAAPAVPPIATALPTAPVASTPIAPAPVAPVTLAPIAPAPVAPAPVTSVPVTPAPEPAIPQSLRAPSGGTVLRLRELGVPLSIAEAAAASTDPYSGLVDALAARPEAPRPPSRPGDILVIAGDGPVALALATEVAATLRIDPAEVLFAGNGPTANTLPAARRLSGPSEAERRARYLHRADVPHVVAVETPMDGETADWARSVADALGATAVWAVVDATRKTADVRAHLRLLGPTAALAVDNTAATADPATVLELGLPTALLDGRPATPAAWAGLLCARLERGR